MNQLLKTKKNGIIKRLKQYNKVNLASASVKITPYDGSSYHGLLKITLKPLKELTLRMV